jgi:hypothetical protein
MSFLRSPKGLAGRFARHLLGMALASAALLAVVRPAGAQTTGTTGSSVNLTLSPIVTRYASDGTTQLTRNYSIEYAKGIAAQDCFENTYLEFTVNAQGAGYAIIQVWASEGSDCTNTQTRNGNTSQCYKPLPNDLPFSYSQSVKFRVQDIVSQMGLTQKQPVYSAGTNDTCTRLQAARQNENISIFFMVLQGDNLIASATATVPVKLGGPPAPTVSQVGLSQSILKIQFASASDTTTRGFVAYCDPLPEHEDPSKRVASSDVTDPDGSTPGNPACNTPPFGISGLQTTASLNVLASGFGGSSDGGYAGYSGGYGGQDSGATGDGGSDGGSTTSGTSSAIVIDSKYECARVSDSAVSEIKIEHVSVGYAYNVAVAAVDAVGNIGDLSSVTCARPVTVNDFWDVYKAGGGPGGGGYCALNGAGLPASIGGIWLLTMSGLALVRILRRRS